MSILKEIILNKRKEIDYLKNKNSISEIEKSLFFDREVISLKKSLIEKSGIISEFKRKSPSKPNINLDAEVLTITRGYEISNSSGLSILTDSNKFMYNIPLVSKSSNFLSTITKLSTYVFSELSLKSRIRSSLL